MTQTKNQPAETIRDGSLSAVIWANSTANGLRYNVELVRSYKVKNDQWQTTPYLSSGEVLRGSRLLNLAYDRIASLRSLAKDQPLTRAAS